jgi:hypothetical protein
VACAIGIIANAMAYPLDACRYQRRPDRFDGALSRANQFRQRVNGVGRWRRTSIRHIGLGRTVSAAVASLRLLD